MNNVSAAFIASARRCHLWNLVAKETREGMVFQRLLEKLEQARSSLGGKVFDILGKLTFENNSLRNLLIEAIRYGNDPEVRDRLNRVVDRAFDGESLQRLLAENALTDDVMDVHRVTAIREEMERMEAHKLQPHFIGAFFIDAFQNVGGKIRPREHGRYEIVSVPYAVRNRDMQIGYGSPVLHRYTAVRNILGRILIFRVSHSFCRNTALQSTIERKIFSRSSINMRLWK